MELFHDDLLLYIFSYVGFGEERGKNMVSYRRLGKRYHELFTRTVEIELDVDKSVSLSDFMAHFPHYRTELQQKRNRTMEWDDYRGFFIVTKVERDRWIYYDKLLQRYFFEASNGSFPHYKGKIYVYEFLL